MVKHAKFTEIIRVWNFSPPQYDTKNVVGIDERL